MRALLSEVHWLSSEMLEDGWSHLAVPVIVSACDTELRFVCSSRDQFGHSHAMTVEVGMSEGGEVVASVHGPILSPGVPGAFDDSGVMPCCAFSWRGSEYLAYVAWSKGINVPFRNAVGLALWNGGELARAFPGPWIDRGWCDPFFIASCDVLADEEELHVFYTSGAGWTFGENKPEPHYGLKVASGTDLFSLERDGKFVVEPRGDAWAATRPSLAELPDGTWLMAYCSRGERYQIHLLRSPDLCNWSPAGTIARSELETSPDAYPCLFWWQGELWLAFNGPEFGLSGMGFGRLRWDLL